MYQESEQNVTQGQNLVQQPPVEGGDRPQSPNHGIINQEYLKNDHTGWLVQWRQKKSWDLNIPKIKECKKRKDAYTNNFGGTLYKSPYKYHVNLSCGGMGEDEQVFVQLALNYENGESIQHSELNVLSNGPRELKITKFEKSPFGDNDHEVTIGPFQFNVCSFRQDGRKFRLVMHLFASAFSIPHLVCSTISPPFTIRAKKPIKNPGTRKRKRNVGDSTTTSRTRKKRKTMNETKKVARPPPRNKPLDHVGLPHSDRRQIDVSIPTKGTNLTNHLKMNRHHHPPTNQHQFVLPYQQPQQDMHQFHNPMPIFRSSHPSKNPLQIGPSPRTTSRILKHTLTSEDEESNQTVEIPPIQNPDDLVQMPEKFRTGLTPRGGVYGSDFDYYDYLLNEETQISDSDAKGSAAAIRIVSEYSSMGADRRMDVLTRLMEISFPHERNQIKTLFFTGIGTQQNSRQNNRNMMTDVRQGGQGRADIGGSSSGLNMRGGGQGHQMGGIPSPTHGFGEMDKLMDDGFEDIK